MYPIQLVIEYTSSASLHSSIGTLSLTRCIDTNQYFILWASSNDQSNSIYNEIIDASHRQSNTILSLQEPIPNSQLLPLTNATTCYTSNEFLVYASPKVESIMFQIPNESLTIWTGKINSILSKPSIWNTFASIGNTITQTWKKSTKRPVHQNHSDLLYVSNPWISNRPISFPDSLRINSPLDCPLQSDLKSALFIQSMSPQDRPIYWPMLFANTTQTSSSSDSIQSSDSDALSSEYKDRIFKDVLRTDRNHTFYQSSNDDQITNPNGLKLKELLENYAINHPDIAYLQGMNEIASTILYVCNGNSLHATRIFEHLMQSHHLMDYCREDGLHMQRQLHLLSALIQCIDPQLHSVISFTTNNDQYLFAHRWLLLLFKREFQSLDDHASILEVIMSAPVSSYEVILAAALLLMNRNHLLLRAHRLDLTLQHFSSSKQSVDQLLNQADQILRYLQSPQAHSRLASDPTLKSFLL